MMNNLGFYSLLTILLLTETASVRAISRLYKNDELFLEKLKCFSLYWGTHLTALITFLLWTA